MSFAHYKKTVDYGDTVVLYIGFDNMLQFEVIKNKTHQTKYGAIKHDDLIGTEFGKKLQLKNGYVFILHPTPELWTTTLRHRTQILYSTDISLITLQLDLKPGSVVIESGTGSASLSHAILRSVFPTGHLHTFDFHEVRAKIALEEFKSHGFESDVVTVKHRDVCQFGFDLVNVADAVFLDLPKPWLAVPFAKEALLAGGRICSFSPCLEQVQKCCLALKEQGFTDIETWECLNRPLEVRPLTLPIADLGYQQDPEHAPLESQLLRAKPIMGVLGVESDPKERSKQSKNTAKGKNPQKKMKLEDDESKNEVLNEEVKNENNEFNPDEIKLDVTQPIKRTKASLSLKSSMPSLTMAGHTGYLTFATLYPN